MSRYTTGEIVKLCELSVRTCPLLLARQGGSLGYDFKFR